MVCRFVIIVGRRELQKPSIFTVDFAFTVEFAFPPLFFLLTLETEVACPQLNLVNSDEDSYRDFIFLVMSLAFNGGAISSALSGDFKETRSRAEFLVPQLA